MWEKKESMSERVSFVPTGLFYFHVLDEVKVKVKFIILKLTI